MFFILSVGSSCNVVITHAVFLSVVWPCSDLQIVLCVQNVGLGNGAIWDHVSICVFDKITCTRSTYDIL